MNFLSRDKQQINQWRFYAGQEHTLGKGWGLNYGIIYTTALDHSYQRYYDPETDNLLPDNNMNSRRREQTLNAYAGLSKASVKTRPMFLWQQSNIIQISGMNGACIR